MKPRPNSYYFTYVYKFLFKEFDILFLLSTFEANMLIVIMINVASSQLHPNNLTFLKSFHILFHCLDIESFVNKLMYFYQVKHMSTSSQ